MAGHSMHLRFGMATVFAWVVVSLMGVGELLAQAPAGAVPAPQANPNQSLRNLRGMVTKALRDDAWPNGPADEKDFVDYFANFIFPQFIENANLTKLERLPQLRRELRTVYLLPGRAGAIHNKLVDLTHNWMRQVIGGNWHIVFKYNAMLVIGELNQKEAQANLEAVPYPPALSTMLFAVSSAKFDAQDYLRFAAMIGIQRHADSHNYSPLGGASVANITATILPVAQQQTPTIKRSIEGHNWYRRSAINILGAMGDPGSNGSVVTTLEATAMDPKTNLSLRCAAAESLGKIKYGGMKVDYARLIKTIGLVVCDLSNQQLNQYKSDPKSYDLKRVLRSNLGPIHEAIISQQNRPNLSASSQGSPQQATVAAITAKIGDICKVCDSDKSDSASLSTSLPSKIDALQKLIAAPAAAGPVAGRPAAAPAAPPAANPAGAPAAPAGAGAPAPNGAQVAAPPSGPATAAPSAPLAAGGDGAAATTPQNQ